MNFLLEEYISRDELAKQLGLKSTRSLARWEGLGVGPAVTRIARKPYYRLDAVREWLLSREKPALREEPRRRRYSRPGAE